MVVSRDEKSVALSRAVVRTHFAPRIRRMAPGEYRLIAPIIRQSSSLLGGFSRNVETGRPLTSRDSPRETGKICYL